MVANVDGSRRNIDKIIVRIDIEQGIIEEGIITVGIGIGRKDNMCWWWEGGVQMQRFL